MKAISCRSSQRDMETELNLPPGFRFHPTDEELVLHYLCRKVSCQCLPVPIIPDVDLYRYDPWQLPEMALFGTKEWYFFSPRDRKYPNGLRPNRAAGNGYWKATGADKPIRPRGCATHVGIKKALVFYSGKPPSGIKTNWIMHEYRLAKPNRPSNDKGSLRLDGWVLCRIYNKKNDWEKIENQHEDDHQPAPYEETVDSSSGAVHEDGSSTPESAGNSNNIDQQHRAPKAKQHQGLDGAKPAAMVIIKEDNDCWLMNLNSGQLQNNYSLAEFGATLVPELTYQDYCFSSLWSPHTKPLHTNIQLPF